MTSINEYKELVTSEADKNVSYLGSSAILEEIGVLILEKAESLCIDPTTLVGTLKEILNYADRDNLESLETEIERLKAENAELTKIIQQKATEVFVGYDNPIDTLKRIFELESDCDNCKFAEDSKEATKSPLNSENRDLLNEIEIAGDCPAFPTSGDGISGMTYREWLIGQIASGAASNLAVFKTGDYEDLPECIAILADDIIEKLAMERIKQ